MTNDPGDSRCWRGSTHIPPPAIDERVAPAFGRLALAARTARRDVRRGTADLLIAATAETHGLTLLTRDEKLARLPGLDVELV